MFAPELDRCYSASDDVDDRAGCYMDVLFGDGGIAADRRPESPAANAAATALVEGRGSCAALIAIALAATEDLDSPFEAVVLRDHVLLGLRDGPALYEVLEHGRSVEDHELRRYSQPPGGPARVSGRAYLPYYLDNLAARFAESGNVETAERVFLEALELGPQAARVHYNYGTFLLGLDRADEALDHLSTAIRLGWKDADTYVNRGVALWKLGRVAKARRSFGKALKLDPGDRRARDNMRRSEQSARGSP